MPYSCIDGPLKGEQREQGELFRFENSSDRGAYRLTDGVYAWHAETMQQRRKIILSYSLAGFYGVALLLWPFAVFISAFAFDSPHVESSPWYPLLLYGALSNFFYPVYWGLGFHLGFRSAERDEAAWVVVLKSSIPLLSGTWVVAVPMFAELVLELLLWGEPL